MKEGGAYTSFDSRKAVDKWDKLFEELVAEKVESLPIPSQLSIDEGFQRLEERIEREKRKSKRKQYKLTAAAVILVIIVFSTVWTPPSTHAFGKLFEVLHIVQDSVMQIMGGSSQSNGPSGGINDEGLAKMESTEFTVEETTFSNAQKIVPFKVLQPNYMSDKYRLEQVKVYYFRDDSFHELVTIYVHKQNKIFIHQKYMGEEYGFGVITDNNQQMEEISINGFPASLIYYEEGTYQIIWINQGHYVSIEAKIAKEEIIAIAESLY